MNKLKELSYEALIEKLNELTEKYEDLRYDYIGESVFSRPIPLVTLGSKDAKKSVLYVSTHHATENITSYSLIKFIEDYMCAYEAFRQLYMVNLRYLFKMRKIYIIPILNPDGVDYRLNGIGENNPIKERVLAYNEGSVDFSHWNANARGVDLNHNYDAGFMEYKALERGLSIMPGATKYSGECQESEPEVSALCNFIRYHIDEIEGVLSLHTQGEEIYYSSGDILPEKSKHLAKIISRLTGYTLSKPTGTASYGGLTDWLIQAYNKPSFTLECGIGENPLPMTQAYPIYSRLRELLFTFPILF